jgi:hypothetical protein
MGAAQESRGSLSASQLPAPLACSNLPRETQERGASESRPTFRVSVAERWQHVRAQPKAGGAGSSPPAPDVGGPESSPPFSRDCVGPPTPMSESIRTLSRPGCHCDSPAALGRQAAVWSAEGLAVSATPRLKRRLGSSPPAGTGMTLDAPVGREVSATPGLEPYSPQPPSSQCPRAPLPCPTPTCRSSRSCRVISSCLLPTLLVVLLAPAPLIRPPPLLLLLLLLLLLPSSTPVPRILRGQRAAVAAPNLILLPPRQSHRFHNSGFRSGVAVAIAVIAGAGTGAVTDAAA